MPRSLCQFALQSGQATRGLPGQAQVLAAPGQCEDLPHLPDLGSLTTQAQDWETQCGHDLAGATQRLEYHNEVPALFRTPVEEQNDRKSKPEPASLQFRVPSEDKPASKPLPRNMEECEHMFGGLAMTAQDKEELLEFMRRCANRNAASATATPKASVQPPAAAGIEQQFTPLGGPTTPDETVLESQSDAELTLPSSQFCETKPAPVVPPRELEPTALLPPPPATPHTHFFPRTNTTLAHAGSFATPAPRFLEFLQPARRSAAGLSQDPGAAPAEVQKVGHPTPEQPAPTLMKDKELKAVSARAAAQAARKLKEVKSEQEDSDTVLSPEEQAKYQGWWSRYQKRSSDASLSEASLKRSKSSPSEAWAVWRI